MLKQKLIKRNEIASVDYVVIETKRLSHNKRVQQISAKILDSKTKYEWVETVQEIEIWPYEQVLYVLHGIPPGEWDEQMETIQSTALLRSARILRWVLEAWGDLLSLKLLWEAIR